MTGIVCALPGVITPTAVAAAFSVPTAEFTNDANTRLLLHFNGTNGATTTTDDGAGARTAKTVTASGNAQVDTAQSKFGGASALFDGSGDYLTVSPVGTDLYFPAGQDVTIEMWIRPNITQQFNPFFALGNARGASSGELSLYIESFGGQFFLRMAYNFGAVLALTSAGGAVASNNWYHVAYTRQGDVHRLFLNGALQETETDAGLNLGVSGQGFKVGSWADASGFYTGHVDEVRISSVARYTAAFTAPTAAFVNDADTLLLVHCDGADASTTFTDDNGGRTAKTMTMNSSVLSTTEKKFGTASLYVDGTGGDYVWTDDSGDWDLGNSRTFETWVYINSFTNISRNSPNHIPKLMGHMNQSGTIWWAFGPNTEGGLSLYYWRGANDWTHSTTKDLVTGQWYHIALVIDSSGVAKGYVNGVEYLSETLTSPSAGNTAFAIGAEFGQAMNAYIDEFRVSHVNRYT